MERKTSVWLAVFGILPAALLVLLDQMTKQWAASSLQGRPNIILIKGVMELSYLENRGAAFGILQNQQWLFVLLFFVVLAAACLIYWRIPLTKRFLPVRFIAVLVIAGGIGNLIDRLRQGYVVDFFYFSLIDFPVFNVADIFVTGGMILLLLLLLFYYREEDLDQILKACFFGRSGRDAGESDGEN